MPVRAIALALVGLVLLSAPAAAKYAAMVVDAETGRVYFARNADARNHPASLTKMMTLYMVFEALESKRLTMNQPLTVSKYAARRPPSRLRLRAGQTITVRQAIEALAVKSANDVAAVVAEALGGSERSFARLMTKRARQLGMSRTTFGNASGLPHRAQRSTARDMVTLALALRRDFPQYYSYFSQKDFRYKGRTYRTHNNLLGRFAGTTGIKTGYTNAAGFNLVAAVERGEHRLIGVVFGGRTARSRDRHMRRILGRVFYQLDKAPHIITPERVPIPAFRPDEPTRVRAAEEARERAAREAGVPVPALKPPAGGTIEARRPVRAGEADQTGWAVQFGAYSNYGRASQMAQRIAEREPALAAEGLAIEPLQRGGHQLYRARISGLSEFAARRACARLERKALPCVPVGPDGGV
ncbi:MAG: D-alanyl-D-alanine carboxypeptidase [Alphaproteobacteria bacterium]